MRNVARPASILRFLLVPLAGAAVGCAAGDASRAPGAVGGGASPPGSAAAGASAALSAAPADPSTLTVPGPAASPCTNDSMCLNHRCNLQYGKCAFPCASDADCVRGTSCFRAVISTCQPSPPNE